MILSFVCKLVVCSGYGRVGVGDGVGIWFRVVSIVGEESFIVRGCRGFGEAV